jgi:hypothetical protein
METGFGHDFSRVRVHVDPAASESANQLAARAYTVGHDIVFRAGEYHPDSMAGKELLAHELAHVVQQTSATESVQRIDEDDERTPDERSRQSRPRNAPRGTVPIDQSGLDRETIHKIKDAIGAGPRDWVGITPDGHVIVTDGEGNAEDVGHVSDFARSGAENVPKWVWGLLALAAMIALIVLFATGVGEVGLILAGASLVVILAVKAALRAAGRGDTTMASTAGEEESEDGNVAA